MSQQWIYTIVYLAWLAGAACFVLGLHRMNSPATGRSGNQLGAAALVAIDDFIRLNSGAPVDTTIFVVLGALIGSVTFSGSLIAGGKLQGLIPGKPIYVPGGQLVTIGLAVVAVLGTVALILGAAGVLSLGSSATL